MKRDVPKDEKRMLNIGANICCFPLCVLSEYTDVSKLGAWPLQPCYSKKDQFSSLTEKRQGVC